MISDNTDFVDIRDDDIAVGNDVISHSLMHSQGFESVALLIVAPSATNHIPADAIYFDISLCLPHDISLEACTNSFKRKLKTFLMNDITARVVERLNFYVCYVFSLIINARSA